MCALRNEKMDRFALEPQILEFHSGEPAPVRRRRSGGAPAKGGPRSGGHGVASIQVPICFPRMHPWEESSVRFSNPAQPQRKGGVPLAAARPRRCRCGSACLLRSRGIVFVSNASAIPCSVRKPPSVRAVVRPAGRRLLCGGLAVLCRSNRRGSVATSRRERGSPLREARRSSLIR